MKNSMKLVSLALAVIMALSLVVVAIAAPQEGDVHLANWHDWGCGATYGDSSDADGNYKAVTITGTDAIATVNDADPFNTNVSSFRYLALVCKTNSQIAFTVEGQNYAQYSIDQAKVVETEQGVYNGSKKLIYIDLQDEIAANTAIYSELKAVKLVSATGEIKVYNFYFANTMPTMDPAVTTTTATNLTETTTVPGPTETTTVSGPTETTTVPGPTETTTVPVPTETTTVPVPTYTQPTIEDFHIDMASQYWDPWGSQMTITYGDGFVKFQTIGNADCQNAWYGLSDDLSTRQTVVVKAKTGTFDDIGFIYKDTADHDASWDEVQVEVGEYTYFITSKPFPTTGLQGIGLAVDPIGVGSTGVTEVYDVYFTAKPMEQVEYELNNPVVATTTTTPDPVVTTTTTAPDPVVTTTTTTPDPVVTIDDVQDLFDVIDLANIDETALENIAAFLAAYDSLSADDQATFLDNNELEEVDIDYLRYLVDDQEEPTDDDNDVTTTTTVAGNGGYVGTTTTSNNGNPKTGTAAPVAIMLMAAASAVVLVKSKKK